MLKVSGFGEKHRPLNESDRNQRGFIASAASSGGIHEPAIDLCCDRRESLY
ncbi:hypothetical protein [Trichocoleus sp. AS-A1]|uniref:hypothetical protein n=1 Tax=Trichocoleus sp. AS-A1 TaxID=2933921 RepID=UPI0016821D1B